MPATAAFWTSSKLARPLTSRIEPESGVRPARNSAPISLSSALCRPTSSRRPSRRPAGSNRAEACRPPVRSKVGLGGPERPGQALDHLGLDRPSDRSAILGPQLTRTASIEDLPQTPQLDAA